MNHSMQDPVLLAVNQVLPIDQNRPVPPATSAARGAPRKRAWLAAAMILGLAACLVFGVVIGDLAVKVVTDSPRVERVLADFMSAMAQRDTQTAYALFSSRARNEFPPSNLDKLVQGANYCAFEGFQDVTINSFVFNAAFNNDPTEPQGVTAKVQGTVSYEGGFTGTLSAILVQEGGEYRLHFINVVVPPTKFER